MSELQNKLEWRYATKKMNPAKAVPQEKVDRILEAARLALGENDFSAAWEAGRAMTEEQVLQSAMDYLREEG